MGLTKSRPNSTAVAAKSPVRSPEWWKAYIAEQQLQEAKELHNLKQLQQQCEEYQRQLKVLEADEVRRMVKLRQQAQPFDVRLAPEQPCACLHLHCQHYTAYTAYMHALLRHRRQLQDGTHLALVVSDSDSDEPVEGAPVPAAAASKL